MNVNTIDLPVDSLNAEELAYLRRESDARLECKDDRLQDFLESLERFRAQRGLVCPHPEITVPSPWKERILQKRTKLQH